MRRPAASAPAQPSRCSHPLVLPANMDTLTHSRPFGILTLNLNFLNYF